MTGLGRKIFGWGLKQNDELLLGYECFSLKICWGMKTTLDSSTNM